MIIVDMILDISLTGHNVITKIDEECQGLVLGRGKVDKVSTLKYQEAIEVIGTLMGGIEDDLQTIMNLKTFDLLEIMLKMFEGLMKVTVRIYIVMRKIGGNFLTTVEREEKSPRDVGTRDEEDLKIELMILMYAKHQT